MTANAYLVAGLRSPIGAFGGALRPLRATEFGSTVAAALLQQTGLKPDAVQRVIGGMVLQDMTESNPARIVAERIGVPHNVPAFTVNMQCCSSMTALILAAQQVALGEVDTALALGLESMSNAPHMVPGSRWGHRLGHGEFVDTLKECTLAGSKMWDDPWYMIDVAEHHAREDQVTREEMDEYAVVSHTRALAAMDAGWMCQHGEGDLRYGRVVKPLPETGGLSIDVVDMVDVAGPHHAHPKGEVCMTMPQNPDARFDGAGAGWCVNPPGSAHSPTVTDGRALVLYLLPDGQIDFSRAG